jgi:hypothetical protein
VQEHRADERRRFLHAGHLLGGHVGGGLQELAEQVGQLVDGKIAAERPVVDAALQQRPDHRPDLLFHGTVVARPVAVDHGRVFAAARGDHARDAGDSLGHRNGVQASLGEPGGGGVEGDGGQRLQ